MAQVVNTTFKLKRGLLEAWTRANPVLAQGEPGYVLDTNRMKIGDGVTPWLDLPYFGEQSYVASDSYYNFPSVGQIGMFYLDTTNHTLYYWTGVSYQRMASDSTSIVIDTELSETSNNPIANSAVTKAIKDITYTFGEGFEVDEETNVITSTASDEVVYYASTEELPDIGDEAKVYRVGTTIYLWNSAELGYEPAGMNINIINGGNSNG